MAIRPIPDPDIESAPSSLLPETARKGRGAISNRPGRFEPGDRPREDDGWQGNAAICGEEDEDQPPPLATTVGIDASRSIIVRHDSPDLPFFQTINPYRGCEHGCIYCFARPSHAYLGHSPGLDFETRLYRKPEAARLLRAEFSRPSYRPAIIALGANTDLYQPIERRYRITRSLLEVFSEFSHPLGITTKSHNVTADIDILADLARRHLVKVFVSVTTLNRDLARRLEPRASTPKRRLAAIAALAKAGIPVGVSVSPIIPGLTDSEIESIIAEAAAAGAESAHWAPLRLPREVKDLFIEWLAANEPLKAARILELIRDVHGGRLYNAQFGQRMTGSGPYAEMLHQRILLAIRRHGLDRPRRALDLTQFRVPRMAGAQGDLFARDGGEQRVENR